MEQQLQLLSAGMDTIWVVLAAAMIILMEGGFALLEAGLVRQKNSVNIIMKVFVDILFGVLCFFAVGFAFMHGKDMLGSIGTSGFFLKGDLSHLDHPFGNETFFVLHAAFVVAVVSIVSGAVAERMEFKAYIVYAIVMTSFIYPISGHWIWGDGWLADMGMRDFAGSAAIHALGGFSALAAASVLGARVDKYKERKGEALVPWNVPLASVGAFLLWFGWFGFNAGSTLSATDPRIGHIALTTMLASASGGTAVMLYLLFRYNKAEATMVINGTLAGLVGITAGSAFVTNFAAILIGVVCGLSMVFATTLLDKWGIDDPVGAFPVHGVSGVLGTIAVGLFSTEKGLLYGDGWELLGVQLIGLIAICAWGYATTRLTFWLISKVTSLRVPVKLEKVGLDLAWHGTIAMPDKDTIAIEEKEEEIKQREDDKTEKKNVTREETIKKDK